MVKVEMDEQQVLVTATETVHYPNGAEEEWNAAFDIPAVFVRQVPKARATQECDSSQWVQIGGLWRRSIRVWRTRTGGN